MRKNKTEIFKIFKISTLSILGSGILIANQELTTKLGSSSASLIIWVLSCLIAVLQALCYAELSNILPNSIGDAGYLEKAFISFRVSKFIGIFYNLFSILLVLPASSALNLILIRQLFNGPVANEAVGSKSRSVVISVLILLLSFIPEIIPKKFSSLFLSLVFYFKILSLFILSLFILLSGGRDGNFLEKNWGRWPSFKNFVFTLISTTYFFSGYNTCNYLSTRELSTKSSATKNAEKNDSNKNAERNANKSSAESAEKKPSFTIPYTLSLLFSLLIYLFFSLGAMKILTEKELENPNYIQAIINRKINRGNSLFIKITSLLISLSIYIGPIYSCLSITNSIISDLKIQFKIKITNKIFILFPYATIVLFHFLKNSALSLLNSISFIMTFFYSFTFFSLFLLRRKYPSRIILPVVVPAAAFLVSFLILILDLYCYFIK